MATASVTNGQTSSGAVAPDDTEIVSNGGTTTGTIVSSGGVRAASALTTSNCMLPGLFDFAPSLAALRLRQREFHR